MQMQPSVLRRMASVREAFRLRRLARVQHGVWKSCVEQDRHDAARSARWLMIEYLRGACEQWRLAVGLALVGRPCLAAGLPHRHE